MPCLAAILCRMKWCSERERIFRRFATNHDTRRLHKTLAERSRMGRRIGEAGQGRAGNRKSRQLSPQLEPEQLSRYPAFAYVICFSHRYHDSPASRALRTCVWFLGSRGIRQNSGCIVAYLPYVQRAAAALSLRRPHAGILKLRLQSILYRQLTSKQLSHPSLLDQFQKNALGRFVRSVEWSILLEIKRMRELTISYNDTGSQSLSAQDISLQALKKSANAALVQAQLQKSQIISALPISVG